MLTTREVAELLGVKPRTVSEWRWRGYGPEPIRLGHRTVRYRPADVEAWLEQQEAPAARAG